MPTSACSTTSPSRGRPPSSRVFTSAEARLTVGWRARAADFALPARPRYPVIRLVSAVISRLEERHLGPGDLRAALLDRGGRWVAPGIVAGFADRLDGLAATISTDFNIVTLGRSPEAMARAVNRLLELHGGVVVVDGADVAYELPLPLGGVMTRGSVEEAADREEELRAALVARGYPHHEPLFTLFFLSALFPRPLGLPIPTTPLIPANWELRAPRVGTLVGSRLLTREYVTQEIEGVDLAGLLARGAERVTRRDLQALTLTLGRWAAAELTPRAAGDLAVRLRDRLLGRPTAPLLAGVLEVACRRGVDQRAITALARTLGDALDRPAFREVVGEAVDDVLARYRERMGAYPRFWMAVASLLGLIDRERVVAALHAGLRQVAADPDHPVRQRLTEVLAGLPARLRREPEFATRVEAAARDLLTTPAATHVLEEAATALQAALAADLAGGHSETAAWMVERLERARRAVAADAALRGEIDRWVKARVIEAVERHHDRLATFIEKGVLALGPEGAVRLIEEHAGDDLQYIRVNGTVVGR